MVQPDRPEMIINIGPENLRFACRMSKATDTNSEYVIVIAFLLQQRFRERS